MTADRPDDALPRIIALCIEYGLDFCFGYDHEIGVFCTANQVRNPGAPYFKCEGVMPLHEIEANLHAWINTLDLPTSAQFASADRASYIAYLNKDKQNS